MSDQVVLPQPLQDYYNRIGAEVLNFRRAIVKQHHGKYYTERALIRIGADGEVKCSKKEYEPTDEEKKAIAATWQEGNHPRAILATKAAAKTKLLSLDGPTFVFWSRVSDGAIMIQQRTVTDDGKRLFVPWTFWSDGIWRAMEPDGPLPLWKPEKSSSNALMIHEGAKAAQAAERIARDPKSRHPWSEELSRYEHWGMIGGALAPHRTDYSEIIRHEPSEVVYVCDNDYSGKTALQAVSKNYGRKMKGVRFDDRWAGAWDMADEMPPGLFVDGRYVGPDLKELMEPATWATEPLYTGEKGRPPLVVKRDFAEEWHHSVTPEAYTHRDWPNRVFTLAEFNNRVRPFSDVNDTASLLKANNSTKGIDLKYNPAANPGIFVSGGVQCLNTHVPSGIRPESGDVAPFLEYMDHLIVDPRDRRELLKWVVTLVAKPETKILYGVLLISEQQGVGKSTLGERILAPLVGMDNVSSPTETEIVDSDFNYWAAHKRLAVVHEIYAGHSAKAYNKLKSLVTDDHIVINKKFQAAYQIENWLHILACSNSMNALKLSVDDRRWFVPKVTEQKKPADYWQKLNHWLRYQGGLGIIKAWAIEQAKDADNIVFKGEGAPSSEAKKEVIEEGFSPGMKFFSELLEDLREEYGTKDEHFYLLDTQAQLALKEIFYQGRENDRLEKPITLRKVAKSLGFHVREEKVQARQWGSQPARYGKVISNDPLVDTYSWAKLNELKPVDIVDRATKRLRFG